MDRWKQGGWQGGGGDEDRGTIPGGDGHDCGCRGARDAAGVGKEWRGGPGQQGSGREDIGTRLHGAQVLDRRTTDETNDRASTVQGR